MRAAVELTGITKRFDDVVAVDDLDLQIRDGEFFSLLGPSGCGKTTTLRMIAGLEFPTEGSIRVFDEEMGLQPPNKRPINTVFQSYALFPHMTVEQNIGFGLEMLGTDESEIRRRAGEAIELVRLTGMEKRKPKQLSGGQQQRVAVARAVVGEPALVLADEPTANLDTATSTALIDLMAELNRDLGTTFVFATHDTRLMDRARRVVRLVDGAIVDDDRRD